MTNIEKDIELKDIDEKTGTVTFANGTKLTVDKFNQDFQAFLQNRIAGETVTYADMERFMRYRTSGKSLELLMKNKKSEGFAEGSGDKKLTRGQTIAIGTVVTVTVVIIMVFIILKGQGMLPI